jgi:hypothetical protein
MATTTNNGWTTPDDTDLVKDGALAIRDLGQEIDTSVGDGLLAWQSYAPVLSGGWLNGNGTYEAVYCQIGKTVHVRLRFTVGSTTTKGTTMQFSLPVAASSSNVQSAPNVFLRAASNTFLGIGNFEATTSIRIYAYNVAGTYGAITNITSTVPATWATGDFIYLSFTYEAA